MEKSTHKALVVSVVLTPHTNSDFLSIVHIGGFQCVVRTEDWAGKDIGIFIQPDSVVDVSRPEFSFLASRGDVKDGKLRIRVCKFRKEQSFGLLIHAPEGSEIGDDLAEKLGVEHYEPETNFNLQGDNVAAPRLYSSKYDVDSLKNNMGEFVDGESVYLSEKIHGANMRIVYHNGRQYVGSRTMWKMDTPQNLFWKAFRNHPQLAKFCEANPDVILYGECYGKQVQDMTYGKDGAYFACFDIMVEGLFLSVESFFTVCNTWNIPTVPIIALDIPFDCAKIEQLAEEPSRVPGANHCSEGVVVKSMDGKKCFKLVSFNYYNRK